MSAALFTLTEPSTTAISSAPAGASPRPAVTFPVGARFPRRTADQVASFPPEQRIAPTGPVFPVGARFPRRTDGDAIAYLTGRLATSGTTIISTRRIYPVGARFPRR